jgi:hypothetical protein
VRPSATLLYLLTIQPQTQTSIWLIGELEPLAALAKWHETPQKITKQNMGAEFQGGPRPIHFVRRCPNATISRGPSENPVHGATDRRGACRDLLRGCGRVAFHQARTLLENHASLHSMARCNAACERACEILGGLGLLVSGTRRAASWGLVALLIAVFPANIYMATHPIEAGAASIARRYGGAASLCNCSWSGGCSGARSPVTCFVEAWILAVATRFGCLCKALDIPSNLSGPDHREVVCNSKFVGSQAGYLGNENRPGVVPGFQRYAR